MSATTWAIAYKTRMATKVAATILIIVVTIADI